MNEPDWLGPAQDCLKQHGLDDAAQALADMEAAVAFLEDEIEENWVESSPSLQFSAIGHPYWGPLLEVVARFRGETPEEAFKRLAPSWHAPHHETINAGNWDRYYPGAFAASGVGVILDDPVAPGTAMARTEEGEFIPYRPFWSPADLADEVLARVEALMSRGHLSKADASEITRIAREGGIAVVREPDLGPPAILLRDRNGFIHRFPVTP